MPEELPDSQSTDVRLYDTRGNVGDLVRAVLVPSEKNDAYLRHILKTGSGEASSMNKKMATSLTDISDELMTFASFLRGEHE